MFKRKALIQTDTLKNMSGQRITSKFKSTDIYNFGSSSDSEAFNLDVDIGIKESKLKSLKRGGAPTPLAVTRFKPTPKYYTRPTPKKKNLAPAPSKQRKLPAKPLEMFSNILSPLSEESESN